MVFLCLQNVQVSQNGWQHQVCHHSTKIGYPGMVAEHKLCLLYCLQEDCVCLSQVFKKSCGDDEHFIFFEFAISCLCDHVQVQEEGRTMDKPWIDKWEKEKTHCIAMNQSKDKVKMTLYMDIEDGHGHRAWKRLYFGFLHPQFFKILMWLSVHFLEIELDNFSV